MRFKSFKRKIDNYQCSILPVSLTSQRNRIQQMNYLYLFGVASLSVLAITNIMLYLLYRLIAKKINTE